MLPTYLGEFFTIMEKIKKFDKDEATAEEKRNNEKIFKLTGYNGSILSLLKPFIIEPTLFVSKSAYTTTDGYYLKAIDDQIDLFANFYSQAFKVLVEYKGLDVDNAISLLRTNERPHDIQLALKEIKDAGKYIDGAKFLLGNEALDKHAALDKEFRSLNSNKFLSFETVKRSNESSDGSFTQDKEAAPLGGYQVRNFNLKFKTTNKDGDKEITRDIEIPIIIKCNIIVLDSESLKLALDVKKSRNSFIERWLELQAGGITWKDFIFGADLIREYGKSKRADSKNIIDLINKHSKTSKYYGVNGGNTFERYYNMFCITESDVKLFESLAGGSMDNPKTKEIIFTKLNAQQIMVLDTQGEMGKLYLQTFPQPSLVPFSKLGNKKGQKNDDLSDLFKALLTSKASAAPIF